MLSDIRVLVFHKNKKNFLKRCTVVMCHQHGMSWKKRRLVCNKSLYLVFSFIHHRVCQMCSTECKSNRWPQFRYQSLTFTSFISCSLTVYCLCTLMCVGRMECVSMGHALSFGCSTDPRDHVVKGKPYKSANAVSTLRLPLVSHIQAVIHCLLSSHQQVSIVQKVHFAVVCRRV